MTTHADILNALGIDAVAAATGKSKPAVLSWRDRSSIPAHVWPEIVEMPGARKAGATLINLALGIKKRARK